MRIILAAIAAAVVLSGCNPAISQGTDDLLTWTIPTQRTDGTSLPALQYKETRIQWGTSSAGPFNVGQKIVTGTATSTSIAGTGGVPGTRCYVAVAVDVNGLESAPSNVACKTVVAPPRAPVLTLQ
jgi:uncharacterized protein YceK